MSLFRSNRYVRPNDKLWQQAKAAALERGKRESPSKTELQNMLARAAQNTAAQQIAPGNGGNGKGTQKTA